MRPDWDPKSPSLLPTIVCYADILGFQARIERAHALGEEAAFLQRIKRSLAATYETVRKAKTLGESGPSIFDMKVFTDNIVVAYPLLAPSRDHGEPELGTLLMLFAQVQASLAMDGFLLRGAIAYGNHYQDDDIVYGKALMEAVDLDKSGGSPRLVVASSVEPLISKHLSWYGDGSWAPHYEQLLEDPRDGQLFINYLGSAFEHFPDGPIDHKLLTSHGERACEGLKAYQSAPDVRAKYEWMTTYHNYVCHTFADQYLYQVGEEAYTEQMAIVEEVQRVLEHTVPFEGLPSELCPRPLDAQRLRQRLTRVLPPEPLSSS